MRPDPSQTKASFRVEGEQNPQTEPKVSKREASDSRCEQNATNDINQEILELIVQPTLNLLKKTDEEFKLIDETPAMEAFIQIYPRLHLDPSTFATAVMGCKEPHHLYQWFETWIGSGGHAAFQVLEVITSTIHPDEELGGPSEALIHQLVDHAYTNEHAFKALTHIIRFDYARSTWRKYRGRP